jgi:transposase-like protein
MSAESRKLVELTNKIAVEMGVKFCTSCNLTKPVEGGKTKPVANGRSRWLCASCAERKKLSGYGKVKNEG